jgi:hypothetical protein
VNERRKGKVKAQDRSDVAATCKPLPGPNIGVSALGEGGRRREKLRRPN